MSAGPDLRTWWASASPRERDARVAESLGESVHWSTTGEAFRRPPRGGALLGRLRVPPYSTSWEHAGGLLDRLASEGFDLALYVSQKLGVHLELEDTRGNKGVFGASGEERELPSLIGLCFFLSREQPENDEELKATARGWEEIRDRLHQEGTFRRIDQAARILELEAQLAEVLRVATGEARHDFQGLCPDATDGFDQRDPDCPACKILLAAEATLQPACPHCGEHCGWDEKFSARVCRGCQSCVPREDGQLRFTATLRGETTDAPE